MCWSRRSGASSCPTRPRSATWSSSRRELAPRYAEFIGNEIQKAYLESYHDYGQNLFDRYVAYADAWIEDHGLQGSGHRPAAEPRAAEPGADQDREAGRHRQPEGLPQRGGEVRLRARANNNGQNPSWTSYEKIREVIERRMFSQVEELLPVISFGSKKDSETREEARASSSSAWWRAATPSGRSAGWSNGTCG